MVGQVVDRVGNQLRRVLVLLDKEITVGLVVGQRLAAAVAAAQGLLAFQQL
jgi:hypothetical protein